MVKDSPLALNPIGSSRYEKDAQAHYKSQTEKGPWFSGQNGHQGGPAGPEQKACEGEKETDRLSGSGTRDRVSPAAEQFPVHENRYTLKKHERILRRNEFSAVFQRGKRIHSEYLTIILSQNALGNRRIGIVAGKRAGNAVRRNRMKRLLREFFRLNKHRLPVSQDILIIARKDFSFMKAQDLCTEIEKILAGRMKA